MGNYIIITPFFPSPNSFRGPFVYDYVRAIQRLDFFDNVIVMVPTNVLNVQEGYTYQGIRVYYFPMINMPSYIFNGTLNWLNSILFLKRLRNLKIRIEDIAIAHGHTSTFGAFALALKKRNKKITTLLHHHDPDPYTIRNGKFAGNLLNLWIRAKINQSIFRKIDIHVCVSNYVKSNLTLFPAQSYSEYFQSYIKRLHQARKLHLKPTTFKRIEVLYNGVDLSKFHELPNPSNTESYTIGCIANFIDWKSQLTLLKAFSILNQEFSKINIILKFIGSGPTLNECKDYVECNHLTKKVEFLNEVDHSDLPAIINTFDLFVLPSFFEGFGCVFTEAAACSIPYICCKGQGAYEFLTEDERDLWSIEPEDYHKLAILIGDQIKHPKVQHYRYPLDINVLVADFINKIANEPDSSIH